MGIAVYGHNQKCGKAHDTSLQALQKFCCLNCSFFRFIFQTGNYSLYAEKAREIEVFSSKTGYSFIICKT